jgi:hypothetical protein
MELEEGPEVTGTVDAEPPPPPPPADEFTRTEGEFQAVVSERDEARRTATELAQRVDVVEAHAKATETEVARVHEHARRILFGEDE